MKRQFGSIFKRRDTASVAKILTECWGPQRALNIARNAANETVHKDSDKWHAVVRLLTPPVTKTQAEIDAEKAQAATRRMVQRLSALHIPHYVDENGHAKINKWDF